MIKKYFDFINEDFEFLLESDVKYSEKFRKVLKKVGGSVSDALLGLENKDYPVQSNYFDISDTNDVISFTPDRRVKEILDRNQNKWRYVTQGKYLSSEPQFQYLWDPLEIERKEIPEPPPGTMGTLGKEVISPRSGKKFVVFIPDNKDLEQIPVNIDALKLGMGDEDVDFFNLNRQTIRVGRGVRAILNAAKVNVVDKEIEDFVNKYKAVIDSINDILSHFEVVKGYAIAEWYNYEKYEKGTDRGTLGSSCMADVEDSFFDIYCKNPDKVQLILYKSPDVDGKIKGRALLWKLDDGKMYVDRIYTHEDSDVELFRQYAKRNGYYAKYRNSSSTDSTSIDPTTGNSVDLTLSVHLNPGRHSKYPYLDTFKYYNPATGVIHNRRSDGDLVLEDTDGGTAGCSECDGEGTIECYECNGSGEHQCSNCDGDGTVICSKCKGEDNIICTKCKGKKTVTVDGIEVKCDLCKGEGSIECPDCDGDGRYDCDECDGRGENECEECNGRGVMDCPECG